MAVRAPVRVRETGDYAFILANRETHMSTQTILKHYILKNFLFSDDESALGAEDSLVRGGILDSTGIYELIVFVEEEFKLSIAPEEMIPDNFDTLTAIDAFITRKRAA